ncbi:MAG TPA: peptidylprolyl isomerase, partial [Pyrinomonadaceae bacterium]|nr:peptidylprolyl isomerase [Pyrinomonadaceae bacterium]
VLSVVCFAQKRSSQTISPATLLLITKAEDERRWDDDLRKLFTSPNAAIRQRAALAAGRIGNEDSVAALANLLEQDKDASVRSMAAFAIGEVESETGANALLAVLKNTNEDEAVRARAMEALGKIAAALPKEKEARQRELGAAILDALKTEAERRPIRDERTMILALTAVLRSRPANAGPVIAKFLTSERPRVRTDAANALARLRLKDGNEQLRKLLISDLEPLVRANAARVLGITEDKASTDALVARATSDTDSRVRVSAIRALASLKDSRAAEPLLKRGELLAQRDLANRPAEINEILEIATTLGRLLAQKQDQATINWLHKLNSTLNHTAPEVELAFVRIAPFAYLTDFGSEDQPRRKVQETILLDWHAAAGVAAGLGEFAALPDSVKDKSKLAAAAESLLRAMLDYRNSGLHINTLVAVHSEYAIPDVLRAFAAFKPKDLAAVLRAQLNESDVIVRSTAADLLGDLPPSEENTHALAAAWPQAANDPLNDAALSILDTLGKQKTAEANELIKAALKSNDHLIRRRAVALLKTNGAGDFSAQIGTVQTRNTDADYKRALGRAGRSTQALVTTSKGSFTIELLPELAPLTVDNFVQLAQRGYFRNITVHRVVPNFVIQDGDPRGDGNGGPGYQIRCEINQALYERATVGMALSGKDTGGSQWFVTHSPQPHLDGGYTVFGRVVAGMDVVDRIVRGDIIQSVSIRQRSK